MNLPTYIECPDQSNFFEELTQTLTDGLSDNGWTTPQITAADLATISPSMPDGTLWYVTNAVGGPGPVMLVGGTLVRLMTVAYP